MPWKESAPLKQSYYDIVGRRMLSAERSFKKKDRCEIVDEGVQQLVDHRFGIKVARENGQRE